MKKLRKAAFGAICWKPNTPLDDDAISLVRAFDDHERAISLASSACGAGEQWAVVNLATMAVLASGTSENLRAAAL